MTSIKPKAYAHRMMRIYIVGSMFCIDTKNAKGAMMFNVDTAREVRKWLGKFIDWVEKQSKLEQP